MPRRILPLVLILIITPVPANALDGLPGDGNGDGIVDAADWPWFDACMTGPESGPNPSGCEIMDVEPDGDVDLADFARIQQVWGAIDCSITAAASSIEGDQPQYDPFMAVDGDFSTRWSSEWADGEWIQLDFGRPRTFYGVKIYWEVAYALAYSVWVSPDAATWTPVFSTSSGNGALDAISFAPQTARYLRIDCVTRATQWGSSIWEVTLQSDDPCYLEEPVDPQIESLIDAMTLEEKTSFVYGQTAMDLRPVSRLGIPSLKLADGPLGVRWGQATAFPAAIAQAATWDVELVERVGVAIGNEFRNKGRQVWLGPCTNIVRVPHGGRNFETYGEDPYLNSRMVTAAIRGAQSRNVVACVKHYACNNQEYDRGNINIEVDERTLREIYLPAFRAAVQDAGAWAVMAAYNRVNGPYCTENRPLLTDILKNEWGFDGFVVSDWGAVHSTVPPALAGTDLEMDGASPTGAYWGNGQLLTAVSGGSVAEGLVDEKVRRILRAMSFTGVLDEPWPAPDTELVEHRALVREAGASGIVLLKNELGTLPLDPQAAQTLAVIGPNSYVACVGGGGSSAMWPYYMVSPLEGLVVAAGPSLHIVAEAGVVLEGTPPPALDTSYLRPPGGVGHGLRGEYFANRTLTGNPVLTRIDEAINFYWGTGSPGPGIPVDGFSVRWTGTLEVPQTGTYQLGMSTDDGVRLYLDDVLLIDDWNDHGTTLNDVTVALDEGHAYSLRIEYYENGGEAVAVLSCFSPSVGLDNAVAAASDADAAIVFVGLSADLESEGYDRATMDLDAAQVTLINSVAAVNANTIVVIVAGSQVGMDAWVDNVPAVLQAWYLGQEAGNAIADVVFGAVNPSGRLPMTFVRQWSDHPAFTNYPGGVYTEGLYVGYRHFDKYGIEPLYPFGHGLSYTTFDYRDLVIDATGIARDGTVQVRLLVQNTGSRAGAAVVQVYVRDVAGSVDRPVKELKGFSKVHLQAGEEKMVSVPLDWSSFAYYDTISGGWTVEPGAFDILVGTSSRDIRLVGTVTYP